MERILIYRAGSEMWSTGNTELRDVYRDYQNMLKDGHKEPYILVEEFVEGRSVKSHKEIKLSRSQIEKAKVDSEKSLERLVNAKLKNAFNLKL